MTIQLSRKKAFFDGRKRSKEAFSDQKEQNFAI